MIMLMMVVMIMSMIYCDDYVEEGDYGDDDDEENELR